MELITGYKGSAHVTSADDRELNMGIIGGATAILNVGKKLAPKIVNNNQIDIADGDLMLQGALCRIAPKQVEHLKIETGKQGEKRTDFVIAKYTRDPETQVENVELVVKKGGTGYPVPGELRNGDLLAEEIIYTVHLDGLAITKIVPQVRTISTLADLMPETGTFNGCPYIALHYPGSLVRLIQTVKIPLKFTEPYGSNFIQHVDLGNFAIAFQEKPMIESCQNASDASFTHNSWEGNMTAARIGGAYFTRETRVDNPGLAEVTVTVVGKV